eukprot:scaffold87015_cov75-Phaeocystis_antarctica.AAC.2
MQAVLPRATSQALIGHVLARPALETCTDRRSRAGRARSRPHAAMSSGFRVALLVDRRPLRTTERHGTTYALAAPGRAFEVAVSHTNNATYMARLEVDGVDAEPVRAAGGAQPARVGSRRERRMCCAGGAEGLQGAPAACPPMPTHARAGLPEEGAARRDDAVHGLPLPPRHPRVPIRGDARRRGRPAQ